MSKAALYKKIVDVMKEVGQLQKDGDIEDKNGKKMYSYLSEEQTTSNLQRAFIAHGLVLFPIKVESEIVVLDSFAYEKKTVTPITKVIVTYKIADSETGESEELQAIGYGSDSQDKGSNKAMTGAFKYVQRQTFMISTGDDGDHVSSEELDGQRNRSSSPQRAPQPERQRTEASKPDNFAEQSQNEDLAAIEHESQKLAGNRPSQPDPNKKYVTEGQSKMLYAKFKQSEHSNSKDDCLELISAHLGKHVNDFKLVEASDVNTVIKWLDEHKAA